MWTSNTKRFVFGDNYKVVYNFMEDTEALSDVNVDLLCNYVFNMFEWFLNENNRIFVARFGIDLYEFVCFEQDMMEFKKFVIKCLPTDYEPALQNIRGKLFAYKECFNKFDSRFIAPKRIEHVKNILDEIQNILSEYVF